MALDITRLTNEQPSMIVICYCVNGATTQKGRVVHAILEAVDKYTLVMACNQCGAHDHDKYVSVDLIAMFPQFYGPNPVPYPSAAKVKVTVSPHVKYCYPGDKVGIAVEKLVDTGDAPMTPRQRHEWFYEQMRKDF